MQTRGLFVSVAAVIILILGCKPSASSRAKEAISLIESMQSEILQAQHNTVTKFYATPESTTFKSIVGKNIDSTLFSEKQYSDTQAVFNKFIVDTQKLYKGEAVIVQCRAYIDNENNNAKSIIDQSDQNIEKIKFAIFMPLDQRKAWVATNQATKDYGTEVISILGKYAPKIAALELKTDNPIISKNIEKSVNTIQDSNNNQSNNPPFYSDGGPLEIVTLEVLPANDVPGSLYRKVEGIIQNKSKMFIPEATIILNCYDSDGFQVGSWDFSCRNVEPEGKIRYSHDIRERTSKVKILSIRYIGTPSIPIQSSSPGDSDRIPLPRQAQVKTVTDYFLDAPVGLLGMIDDTTGKLLAQVARSSLIKLRDDHNGYLQVEGNALISKFNLALFNMKDGSHLLGIQEMGGSVAQIRFLRRTPAGQWTDATTEVWPTISREFILGRFLKTFPKAGKSLQNKVTTRGGSTVYYELPRNGTTIIAKSWIDEPEFYGKELFKIRFNRERFEVVP